jgi:hypothetical protein
VSRPSGTQSGVLDVHPADSRFACLQYIIYQQILQVPQLKLLLKPTLSTAVETAWLAAGFNRSTSGRYYAISSGCACDESRMFYAASRSSQRPAHALGAVIIRGGYPYILHPRVDWTRLMMMA